MSDVVPANGALMSFIERAAKDESFDVAKFETLLRVRRDEAHDQSRRMFNAAMAACQSEMEPVLRSAPNPGTRSKYAKLETIDQQMRPIYTRHGFSVRYGSAPPPEAGWMRITCTVAHDGGYFEENYLDSPVTVSGPQGGRVAMTPVQAVGSVVTYLRRYLLGMVFNIVLADIVGDDNDGDTREFERAAATATPRAPVKRGPAEKSDQQWQAWLEKLSAACATLYSRSDVADLGGKATVGDALATGPQWVQREISKILAENYARFPDEDQQPAADIEIVGERYAAG